MQTRTYYYLPRSLASCATFEESVRVASVELDCSRADARVANFPMQQEPVSFSKRTMIAGGSPGSSSAEVGRARDLELGVQGNLQHALFD
jgi:hypothetical protein